MERYKKHIFICENERAEDHPRGCCKAKNSQAIRAQFKKRLKELGLNTEMRANGSLCLDACEFGPVAVVYPEQIWYGGITIEDVDEIIDTHLINGKPVKRLLINDKRYNKDAD